MDFHGIFFAAVAIVFFVNLPGCPAPPVERDPSFGLVADDQGQVPFQVEEKHVKRNGSSVIRIEELDGFENQLYMKTAEMCKMEVNKGTFECRSRCATSHQIDYDENRVPRVLITASVEQNGSCGEGYRCAPLFRTMFVLRKEGECNTTTQMCDYRPSTESITIGGFCGRITPFD